MKKLSKTFLQTAGCIGLLLTASMASAGLIVSAGVDNQGTDNVLSNACTGNVTGPATTVEGCLNTNHSFLVNFTSDENLSYTGGQAAISAQDGGFDDLTISLAQGGSTFNKLVLNIDAMADGFVTFTGVPGGASNPFALDMNGQNFFTITGEDFTSISFVTTVLVDSLAQVRLGGEGIIVDNPGSVPEPSIVMLMGLGLAGLGMTRKFKISKAG